MRGLHKILSSKPVDYAAHPEIVDALAGILIFTDDRGSTREEIRRNVRYWMDGHGLGNRVDILLAAIKEAK